MAFVNDAGTTGKKTREERIQSLRNQAQKKKMDEKVRRNAEAFVKRREQEQKKQTVQQAPSAPSNPVAKKTAPAKTTASEPTRKTPVSTWDEYYAKQKQQKEDDTKKRIFAAISKRWTKEKQ